MSKKSNIAIISALVVVGGISYLVYRKYRGGKEVSALTDYIDGTYTQTNLSTGGDEAITNIGNIKIDPNKIRIGSLFGNSKTTAIRDAIAKTVTDLRTSMQGGSTDTKLFYSAFYRIKNKNTMAFVDAVYKVLFKEGLFEAMKDEYALYNSGNAFFNDDNTILKSIPFLSKGNWNPFIAKYLQALPDYK